MQAFGSGEANNDYCFWIYTSRGHIFRIRCDENNWLILTNDCTKCQSNIIPHVCYSQLIMNGCISMAAIKASYMLLPSYFIKQGIDLGGRLSVVVITNVNKVQCLFKAICPWKKQNVNVFLRELKLMSTLLLKSCQNWSVLLLNIFWLFLRTDVTLNK